jgi:hypothetical protein
MENWILKMKSWQVFLLFACCYLESQIFVDNTFISGCLFILTAAIYIGWYAILGNTLYRYLPRGVLYSLSWFLIDSFFLLASIGVVLIFFDGNLQVNGLAALPGFYFFFALVHLIWFPAVVMVAIEHKKQPDFSQYAGTMLQLFFWPLGIWFIQPRLNRIQVSIELGTHGYSA